MYYPNITVFKNILNGFIYTASFYVLISFSSCAEHSFALTSLKSHNVENFIRSVLPRNAKWSLSALDVKSGAEIVHAGNANAIPLAPASLVKLFTAAAILDMDDNQHISMRTIIALDGSINGDTLEGNIYIRGTGNSFLSEKDLKDAAENVFSSGISLITGDIVADDSFFDVAGSSGNRQGSAYAPPGSLGLDFHTVAVIVDKGATEMRVEPRNADVRILRVDAGPPGIQQIDDYTYKVSGMVSNLSLMKERFALKDPALYAAGTLRTLLREKGVAHSGRVRKGVTPEGAEIISVNESETLRRVVKFMNMHSLNIVADNLFYYLGAVSYGSPGDAEKGKKALTLFMEENGLSEKICDFTDGSGLSADNKATSECIALFLKKMAEKPWFDAFYDSLPRMGMEGTLQDMEYKNEHIRAKSGRLDDVYGLAGFIDEGKGRMIAFSYIVNVPGADMLKLDNASGEILKKLAGELSL